MQPKRARTIQEAEPHTSLRSVHQLEHVEHLMRVLASGDRRRAVDNGRPPPASRAAHRRRGDHAAGFGFGGHII